jgi:hypothetical protein
MGDSTRYGLEGVDSTARDGDREKGGPLDIEQPKPRGLWQWFEMQAAEAGAVTAATATPSSATIHGSRLPVRGQPTAEGVATAELSGEGTSAALVALNAVQFHADLAMNTAALSKIAADLRSLAKALAPNTAASLLSPLVAFGLSRATSPGADCVADLLDTTTMVSTALAGVYQDWIRILASASKLAVTGTPSAIAVFAPNVDQLKLKYARLGGGSMLQAFENQARTTIVELQHNTSTQTSAALNHASASALGAGAGTDALGVDDIAVFWAGTSAGVFEGAGRCVYDIYKAPHDLADLLVQTIEKALSDGAGASVHSAVSTLEEFLTHSHDLVAAIGGRLAAKWTGATDFGKGRFVGNVAGYLAATVIIAAITEGATVELELATGTTELAEAARVFMKVTDPLEALRGLKKVGASIPTRLRRGIGRATDAAGETADRGAIAATRGAADGGHALGEVDAARTVEQDVATKTKTPKTSITIEGFAQQPKMYPWRANADALPRTVAQAREIAAANGVNIPEDIRLIAVDGNQLPKDTYAEYLSLNADDPAELISWERFYNRFEEIPVKVSKEVLQSDEAIVAVMAHEMHELNSLRTIFEARGGALPAQELRRLTVAGRPGNLHDHAWDVADAVVTKMRSKAP